MKKTYNLMYNVGSSRYVVNYHDGVKTHNDGSPFFDLFTANSKKKRDLFVKSLIEDGYEKQNQ